MGCQWADNRLPRTTCQQAAVTRWTRTRHRDISGQLMSPDGIETTDRCPDHPMDTQYGWVPTPVTSRVNYTNTPK